MEISLSDCLACSGCITSAESVLVTQQSQEEMIRVFEEKKQLHVVSSKLNLVRFEALTSSVLRLYCLLECDIM